ncbi:dentin sialophosphoprotein isoform X2 [Senna tora]|uniref:Dentin sialophosphoprotein isoform X2 n=1 Tax=Senna tora TaxID=362788 RepID=A0A834SQ75_9FABA|nr:dentin sialophosphoprotein isoform X2 [Senna tora]
MPRGDEWQKEVLTCRVNRMLRTRRKKRTLTTKAPVSVSPYGIPIPLMHSENALDSETQTHHTMASFKQDFFLLASVFAFLLVSTPAHCKDDAKDSVLKGINSYRQTLNLAVLNKVDKASCLAEDIADDLEDVPCENVGQYYPTAGGILKFPNFQKYVDKCGVDINSTTDGVILPACVAKLEPTILLSNYTHTDRYARYLNNSKYTGVGLGSEDDWMVLVLTTTTPTGAFYAATSSLLPNAAWMGFLISTLPFPSNQINAKDFSADDDDWGDFINHSLQINGGSPNTSNGLFPSNSPSNLSEISNFFDPPGISQDPTDKTRSHVNEIKQESDSNGAFKINHLIANLYNHRPEMNSDNRSISILGSSELNLSGASSNVISSSSTVAAPNADSNGLNSNLNNRNSDLVDEIEDTGDDYDGWEFKFAEPEIRINSENIKVEQTKHETTDGAKNTFNFDNGTLDFGDMLDSSSKISRKADEWNLGFEFSPSSAVQNHISPQLYQRGELNDTKTGYTSFNNNFGGLKNECSESGSNRNLEAPKLAAVYPVSGEVLKDGQGPCDPVDQNLVSKSHQSDEWVCDFNFNPSSSGQDHHISESSKTKQDDSNKNFNAFPENSNVDHDVNLFEPKDAVTGIGADQEKSQINSENRREALSLSIFGDDSPDTDEHSVFQGFSHHAPASSIRNSFNSPGSNLSINDLIWNLYSQAEHNTSPHSTPKASENGQVVVDSNLVTDDDDFNDDSWEFKDATHGTGFGLESVENTFSNHEPQVSEDGQQSLSTVLNPDLINGDFEDDSWEFKDAFCGANKHNQASVTDHKDLPMQSTTRLEPPDYVDFFSKLKNELCNAILFHLQYLKNDQSVATLSGEDAKARALQEEIQEFSDILNEYNIFPDKYFSENHSTKDVSLGELIEVLKEPKFQSLESEYKLTSRLSMELKHGASIWKQSVQKNVHDKILSNPRGFRYIHALGEIYRVGKIIGASAKLHKPWMLSGSVDPASLFALLNECYATWSDSGLEEALIQISNETNLEQDGFSRELIESIKYIHELDEHAPESFVITGEETTCQLSALPASFIPGVKMITWNGKQYLLTVANLWINLVSSDFPDE